MSKLYAMPTVPPVDAPSGLTPPPAERTLSPTDKAATSAFSAALVQAVRALDAWSMQVQLSGDLGADKTALSRAIPRGFGHTERARSPTYTLAEPYDVAGTMGTQKAYHSNPYRLADPEERTDAGFHDCFAGPVLCLVEWPEEMQTLLGMPDLHVALSVSVVHEIYEDGAEYTPRTARLSTRTQTGLQFLQSLQHLLPH